VGNRTQRDLVSSVFGVPASPIRPVIIPSWFLGFREAVRPLQTER
jgi:hypothetical protein